MGLHYGMGPAAPRIGTPLHSPAGRRLDFDLERHAARWRHAACVQVQQTCGTRAARAQRQLGAEKRGRCEVGASGARSEGTPPQAAAAAAAAEVGRRRRFKQGGSSGGGARLLLSLVLGDRVQLAARDERRLLVHAPPAVLVPHRRDVALARSERVGLRELLALFRPGEDLPAGEAGSVERKRGSKPSQVLLPMIHKNLRFFCPCGTARGAA